MGGMARARISIPAYKDEINFAHDLREETQTHEYIKR